MENVNEWHVTVIAYCLIPNHYHICTPSRWGASLSNFLQALFNSYTKAFNKMYNRSGTLFEGWFRAIPILKEEYLIHLCRYIHRNPLEAHLVANLTIGLIQIT